MNNKHYTQFTQFLIENEKSASHSSCLSDITAHIVGVLPEGRKRWTDAYAFTTYSNYINQLDKNPKTFSAKCIFCSHPQSTSLTQDGSFRRCIQCNKDFKASFSNKT